MLEYAGIGMHLLGREGTILWANQAELDLLGYSRDEYIGHPIAEFYADPQAISEIVDRVAASEPVVEAQAALRRKDGGIVYVLAGGHPLRDDESIHSGWFIRDISDQGNARKALRQSEERYRAFIRNSSEGIWRCELDQPIDTSLSEDEQIECAYMWAYMAECNGAMARMYGYDCEGALKGARLSDLFVRADPNNEAFLRAFIRSGYELRDAESHERDVNGKDRFFVNSLVGVVEGGVLVRAWGTQRDVTDQKRTDIALRESQERFSRFMTHLPGAAWIKNLAGQYVYANPEAERIFDRSITEFLGRTDEELFHRETADQFVQNDQRALQYPPGLQTLEMLEQPDGPHESIVSKFPILDEHGAPIFVGGVAIDITERRRAEAALAQSQERLELATSAAKIGTFDWDIPSGRLLWNQQEEELFGLQPGTFEGTIEHWAMRVQRDDLVTMRALMADAMAQQSPKFSFAFRIIRPDGSQRWLEGSARFFYRPNGDPLRMVGVNTDMTERREAESALRRLNAELEEFAYAVSHDLKEPLRMVHAYTQLLLRRHVPSTDLPAQDCAHFIQTGVQRMVALIDDLLAYSRTIHSEDEPATVADLNAALASALMILDEPIRLTHAAVSHDPLPVVNGHDGQFTEVFQNLISNSLKYCHPDRSPRIEIRSRREASNWLISITDNGIGFDPIYADRIFGLFKRLHKNQYPGTGLGLAICKRIIERHEGAIWADGRVGVGSTFTLKLPSIPETPQGT
jgi:PAS domain S-box-containing protein